MSAKYEHIHLFITGRVQGVGYRQGAYKTAQALGLVGWVRNLDDGRVELVAEGPADRIAQLRAWCDRGPTLARVDDVEVAEQRDIAAPAPGNFAVHRA